MKIFMLVLVLFSYTPFAYSETFVGVEGDDELEEEGQTEEIQKPASSKPPEDDPILKRYSDDKGDKDYKDGEKAEESDDSYEGKVTFSASLGANAGSFFASFSVHYYYTKYLGIDTSGFYSSFDNDTDSEERYGPEVDFIVRVPNTTMVTPFIGVGPGYEKWLRKHNDEPFNDSGSFTLNVMYGLNIALSSNFGIQVANRQKTYIDDPPVSFSDRRSHEDRRSSSWGIGFLVMF